MNAIKTGSRVKLKSGGPAMTVGEIYPDGTVDTSWFTSGNGLQSGNFQMDMLELVDGQEA